MIMRLFLMIRNILLKKNVFNFRFIFNKNILIVSHCYKKEEIIRIISVRKATKKKLYFIITGGENMKKNTTSKS